MSQKCGGLGSLIFQLKEVRDQNHAAIVAGKRGINAESKWFDHTGG